MGSLPIGLRVALEPEAASSHRVPPLGAPYQFSARRIDSSFLNALSWLSGRTHMPASGSAGLNHRRAKESRPGRPRHGDHGCLIVAVDDLEEREVNGLYPKPPTVSAAAHSPTAARVVPSEVAVRLALEALAWQHVHPAGVNAEGSLTASASIEK